MFVAEQPRRAFGLYKERMHSTCSSVSLALPLPEPGLACCLRVCHAQLPGS
jgi:hypothetical protein